MTFKIFPFVLFLASLAVSFGASAQDELYERTLNCNNYTMVEDFFVWGDSLLVFEKCSHAPSGSDGNILSFNAGTFNSVYGDLLAISEFQLDSDSSFWIGGYDYNGCSWPEYSSYRLTKYNKFFSMELEVPLDEFPNIDEEEIFWDTGDDINPIQLNDSIVLDFLYGKFVFVDFVNYNITTNENLEFPGLVDVFVLNENTWMLQQETSLSLLVDEVVVDTQNFEEIVNVSRLGDTFIVQVSNGLVILDNNLNELGSYLVGIEDVVIDVGISDELSMLIVQNGSFQFLRFDDVLNLLGSTNIETNGNWIPLSAISFQGKITVGGYSGNNLRHGVVKEFEFSGETSESDLDIGVSVSSYDIIQTQAEFWNSFAIFDVLLEDVTLEFTNSSSEEIETFDLYYYNAVHPGNQSFCAQGLVHLTIDTLMAPGTSILYTIPSAVVQYEVFEHVVDLPLDYEVNKCFFVLSPNRRIDQDLSNNQSCIDDSFLVTEINELLARLIDIKYLSEQSTLQISSFQSGTVDIFSITGSLVKTSVLQAGFNELQLSDFQPGIYLSVIQVGERRITEKLSIY